MNNPNPFLPQGSLLEQQSLRRSRLKIAVGCVLAVSVTGLVAMLIQGCERKKPDLDLNPPIAVDTNAIPVDTNTPTATVTNPPVTIPAPATNVAQTIPTPPVAPPQVTTPPVTPEVNGSEYVVVKGDTLAKIAKKNGVSSKALQAANPTVVPTKLKIGQKITIPAGGKTPTVSGADAAATAAPTAANTDAGSSLYTIKPGDNLTKIAKAHGISLGALKAANNLTTQKIVAGKKLKIPAKAESAPATSTPAPSAPAVDATPTAPPTPAPATTK